MENDFDTIHSKALEVAKREHPDAPLSHQLSFASGVTYLVTGWSGGIGPTVRVHAVSWAISGDGYQVGNIQFPDGRIAPAGHWEFDRACQFAEPLCFGAIGKLHLACYENEHCFDDFEGDIEALQALKKN